MHDFTHARTFMKKIPSVNERHDGLRIMGEKHGYETSGRNRGEWEIEGAESCVSYSLVSRVVILSTRKRTTHVARMQKQWPGIYLENGSQPGHGPTFQ